VQTGYSHSHMSCGKGASYDGEFERSAFLGYLWSQERRLLERLASEERLRTNDVCTRFRYLDYACGTGRVASVLETYADSSTGVDVSPDMLGVARRKLRRTKLILGDATTTPSIVSGTFSFATAFRFFPNADIQLRSASAEFLAGCVQSGGLLVINNHQNSMSLLHAASKLGRKRWPWKFIRNRDLIRLLKRHGFALEGMRSFGILPATDRTTLVPPGAHRVLDMLCGVPGMKGSGQDTVIWFRRA
jgi:SAM-dependent methyltransferase